MFGPFRLDVLDERLWRRDESIALGRRAFAVLRRLVSQPDQLVTKEQLIEAAWPQTAVSDAVLTTAIRELRRALDDHPQAPHFIQTVHGRGYRFIAPVADERSALPPSSGAACLVGREEPWARLHEWFGTAEQGTRRIGLIAGEAGIGKTALIDAFVSEIGTRGNRVRIARGQSVEHYGAGEAYLPILEALGRLGRSAAVPLRPTLRDYAPSWLAHLPTLRMDQDDTPPPPVTPARMLRELAEALEIFTATQPLVLVLEDLHWSDTATLEWLGYVARRRDPARLLILGTYRPIEMSLPDQPLQNLIAELRRQPQSAELTLDCLSGASIETYIRLRCGSFAGVEALSAVLHRRTGGHPLFLSAIVDELSSSVARHETAAANETPTSVRQFIEHRFGQLSDDDQIVLEAASVAGDPFSVAAVAAASSWPEDRIEACLARWTRAGGFLAPDEMVFWPDGTATAGYRFQHALFQEAAYARTSPERRARCHQQIAIRLERGYGDRAFTLAAELAMHFEQGRDAKSALAWLEQAALNALRRSAYPEAHRHLVHALALLTRLPEDRARLERELSLMLLLGHVLESTKGWGVDEVERAYSRARELCEELGDEFRLLQASWGLVAVSITRAQIQTTRTRVQAVLDLAMKRQDSLFQMAAHTELGGMACLLGESASARHHFQEAHALYDPGQHRVCVATFGADLGLFARIWATHSLWYDGYPDQARTRAAEALNLARELSHPFSETMTLADAAMLHQFCHDLEEVRRLADATIAHATEHGFPYYLTWAQILRGWCRCLQEEDDSGIAEIRGGIDILQATAGVRLPYYRGLLAEACARFGRTDEGLQAIADGLEEIGRTEERGCEAELHRLRGELLRATSRPDDAEACFHAAIDLARGQEAKSPELRASVSLARLWRDQGKAQRAQRLVAGIYGRFTEGFDTVDLREAVSLLDSEE
jgi:DNA-binding winged helix-turn-helix (wHTH) protein/tetratricopeptide (TPR) repeat protein